MKRLLMICLLILSGSATLSAQEASCSAIVEQALSATNSACSNTERNQLCYGHPGITLQPQPGFEYLQLSQVGDRAAIEGIQSLTLSPMDAAQNQWGVVLMQLQANLPDTVPGQNVTFLLFGDVTLENQVQAVIPLPTIDGSISGNVNVRSGPSTDNEIVGGLVPGDVITVNGRNAAGDWVRFVMADDNMGWVYAPLLTVEGDINVLSVVSVADELPPAPEYAPAQAFYFRTGIGQNPCAEAPDDGILIQTPEGVGRINLLINEVHINLGSTAYIQARAGDNMVVNLLDGLASVRAFDKTILIPAGARSIIPLDANGLAAGPPSDIQPVDASRFDVLPLGQLTQPISAHPPLTEAEITAFAQAERGFAGNWTAIDIDGSRMTLQITGSEDTGFSAQYYDFGASVCGTDASGTPIYPADGSGENGYINDAGQLVMQIEYYCIREQRSRVAAAESVFDYDPGTDTLTDITYVWSRE